VRGIGKWESAKRQQVAPAAAKGQNMRCVIITPERTVLDASAEFVAVTLFDGELGIAPSHTPLVGRLGYGQLRVRVSDSVESYYVEGGLVEVVNDVVCILTERAVAAAQIDEAVARQQLLAAQERRALTPEQIALREKISSQSRAQLRIARRARKAQQ